MRQTASLLIASALWIAWPLLAAAPFDVLLNGPTDQQIKGILQKYIEHDHWGVGFVVGIIDKRGKRIIRYGKMDKGDSPAVDGDTLFEIGSITKTFTTLLLSDMIERGEMKLDDPLEKYLPRFFMGGDPAPGIVKTLRVEFRTDGGKRRADAKEKETLELPAGAKVLRAIYGDFSRPCRTADVTAKVAELVSGASGSSVKIRAENSLSARKVPLAVPTWDGRKITLRDLATHRSGLPREKEGDLYEFLSRCRLPRAPGRKAEYSNFGLSLLGHAIELRAGTNYAALLQERICRPLRMESTCITPTPALRARLAKSHNRDNRAAGDLADELAPLPGAGAIRSTANDMLKYLAANLGLEKTPLTPLMERTHTIQARKAFGDADVALPWWVYHLRGADLITHGGTTWGHQTFIGFDKKARRGVVVLANRAEVLDRGVRPLGLYILTPPLKEPVPARVAPDILKSYTGLYEFPELPSNLLIIRSGGDRLIAQFLNAVSDEWLPVSDTKFAYRWGSDSELSFGGNFFGNRTAIFSSPGGSHWNAFKIQDEIPEELFDPTPEPLPPNAAKPRNDSDLQGTWDATARVWYFPFVSMKGTARIAEVSRGVFRGEFDFPKAGLKEMPLVVHYHAPYTELISKGGEGVFRGKLSEERTTIHGHFMVGGRRIGTVLRKRPR